MLREASIAALGAIVVTILPVGAGFAYVLKPSEQRLAMMRPLSLASLFAGLSGLLLGFMNLLRYHWMNETPLNTRIFAIGVAESLVPLLLSFASLTFAWLCVAFAMRRQDVPRG